MSSPRSKLLGLAALLALAAGLSIGATNQSAPPPEVQGEVIASGLEGEGSCDMDGVDITYQTSYYSSVGYRVDAAVVNEIASSCDGASLRLALLHGTTELAVATAPLVTSPSMTIGFTSPATAEAVDGVQIEIAGGTLPIPEQCKQLKLDLVQVGTPGPDTRALGNVRDLFFAQEGADTIDGANQADCIDGGEGNDRLVGGNQDDVLLGGLGSDTLIGDSGKDELLGGPGDDVIEGGEGNDRIDGGDGWDRCVGGAGKNTIVNCEVPVP